MEQLRVGDVVKFIPNNRYRNTGIVVGVWEYYCSIRWPSGEIGTYCQPLLKKVPTVIGRGLSEGLQL